jgi:NADH dehydrogenase FAD-containing subunit
MSEPRVVVIGSSFAGLTAALEARRRLGDDARVTVLDPRPDFTFIPSLIWVPFGLREPDDITFPLAPLYAKRGISFLAEAAEGIDLERGVVTSRSGEHPYDRLVVATGPRLAFERIPGLGPLAGHTQSVCTLDHALMARESWDRFLADPGPVVIGTAQGGSCFGASYEFALNVRHRIEKAGLSAVAPVTFVTAEPFLGHFGLGGVGDSERMVERTFADLGVEGLPNTSITAVRDGEMELAGGRVLPFAYAMIVPPFGGVDVVSSTPGLSNEAGFIPVTDEFRHPEHPEVFAAGVDIAIAPPQATMVPAGVPKTGYMSEQMAKVAAQNIAADLGRGTGRRVPIDELGAICILDGGNTGIILKTDRVLGDAAHPHLMAGPQAHWAKVAFERFFIASRRRGHVRL